MNPTTRTRFLCSVILWLVSFLGVVLWPLLGIAATRHLFDDPAEAALVFAGFIAFLVYLPSVLFGASDVVFMTTIMVLWFVAWVIPMLWLTRRERPLRVNLAVISILSAASLMQAALGSLMILGKGV